MAAFTFIPLLVVVTWFACAALAVPSRNMNVEGDYNRRAASCTFPSPPTTSRLSAPKVISGVFDGGNIRYNRGANICLVRPDGDVNVVFILQSGATLKNAVIGADQVEGIQCLGPCTLQNVWFENVCESAVTIKQTSGTSSIIGGGAKSAEDVVIQHTGGGNVVIDSFCVQDFGKLYRSCNNCKTQYKRTVTISNIIAMNGKSIAGVNSNYGDIATIQSSTNAYTSVNSACDTYKANNNGNESPKLTSNMVNANCVF